MAQTKLTEIWKAINIKNNPLKIVKQNMSKDSDRATRSVTSGVLSITGKTNLYRNSFIGDASKLFNQAPMSIKTSTTLSGAKREIKKYIKTLPI